jgi:hypothetical protein
MKTSARGDPLPSSDDRRTRTMHMLNLFARLAQRKI